MTERGRPSTVERDPNGGRVQLSVLLDYTDKAALIRIAKRRRTSPTELIRTYIAWGLDIDSKGERHS
jgi:hypothetical protein